MWLVIVGAVIILIIANESKVQKRKANGVVTTSVHSGYTPAMEQPNRWGSLRAQIVCAQCQKSGRVFTKPVKRKKGISGGKAVGALLTGGVSILATGLSRKEGVTQAHCMNCQSTWDF